MALLTWQQLHGVNELVQGAVEATTNAVSEVDRDNFRRPYAVLKRIPITANSADTIEQVHETITRASTTGFVPLTGWLEEPHPRLGSDGGVREPRIGGGTDRNGGEAEWHVTRHVLKM